MRTIIYKAGDIGPADLAASAGFIASELAHTPATRHDLFLVVAGEPPRRITRSDGVAMLRNGGAHTVARRLERTLVPTGKVVLLVLTDGARPPHVGLLDVAQAMNLGGGVRGLLGHLAGGPR